MLEKALSPLFDLLTSEDGPCWIDKFGGLARTVVHPECNLYDGATKIKRYPITCNQSVDCFSSGDYENLVPNCNYKSLVYFHQLGMRVSNGDKSSMKHVKKITQQFRMVIWLNLDQLGVDMCNPMEMYYLDLTKHIDCRKWPSTQNGVGLITTNIVAYNSWEDTINKVFRQYNYGDKYQLFLNPYDIGSIDIEVCYHVDSNCVEDIICGDPIPCKRFDI